MKSRPIKYRLSPTRFPIDKDKLDPKTPNFTIVNSFPNPLNSPKRRHLRVASTVQCPNVPEPSPSPQKVTKPGTTSLEPQQATPPFHTKLLSKALTLNIQDSPMMSSNKPVSPSQSPYSTQSSPMQRYLAQFTPNDIRYHHGRNTCTDQPLRRLHTEQIKFSLHEFMTATKGTTDSNSRAEYNSVGNHVHLSRLRRARTPSATNIVNNRAYNNFAIPLSPQESPKHLSGFNIHSAHNPFMLLPSFDVHPESVEKFTAPLEETAPFTAQRMRLMSPDVRLRRHLKGKSFGRMMSSFYNNQNGGKQRFTDEKDGTARTLLGGWSLTIEQSPQHATYANVDKLEDESITTFCNTFKKL